MKKFIIDGNNLIGKIKTLVPFKEKEKQILQNKLTYMIDRHFANKKVDIFLYFDGFAGEKINVSKIKIVFSGGSTADEKIKKQIESEKNKRTLVIVSSDNEIRNFAKVCGCEILSSEEFGKELLKGSHISSEEQKISAIDDVSMFKKLFNV